MNIISETPTMTVTNDSKKQSMIRLQEICLTYKSNNRNVEALRNINQDIYEGEFICVLGPSGCGKTSLLKIIAGYEKATSGDVVVAGQKHVKPNADVGVVFQHPNLFPWLTIKKNVEFGLQMKSMSKKQREEQALYYLDMVGLKDFAHLLPHELSGGMKQRAAIARALANDPKVILMDEPFGALDALTRETMQSHLREIWMKTNKSIYFITHDVEEALLLSTRILVLKANPGRIETVIENPFIHKLKQKKIKDVRLSKEFVEMREYLISKISGSIE